MLNLHFVCVDNNPDYPGFAYHIWIAKFLPADPNTYPAYNLSTVYSDRPNTRLVGYSGGHFVSLSEMVQFSQVLSSS